MLIRQRCDAGIDERRFANARLAGYEQNLALSIKGAVGSPHKLCEFLFSLEQAVWRLRSRRRFLGSSRSFSTDLAEEPITLMRNCFNKGWGVGVIPKRCAQVAHRTSQQCFIDVRARPYRT